MILALLVAAQITPATATLRRNQQTLSITSLLALAPVGKGGRVPFPIDPIQYQVVTGEWRAPKPGDSVPGTDGKAKQWQIVQAGKEDTFTGDPFEGGYAYCTVHSDSNRVMLLRAIGDAMVYVNGEPQMGDPYGYGFMALPIKLHEGDNSFLFATGRGQMKVQLETPRAQVMVNDQDATLPDLRMGAHDQLGAVVVINCGETAARGYQISTAVGAGGSRNVSTLKEIPPLSAAKVPIRIIGSSLNDQNQTLFVTVRKREEHDEAEFKLRFRNANQTRKETYRSTVDGSVQYYAVVPPPQPKPNLSLILSLHGASVEATGQADAYSPKDWAWIVCATNRRPFGFDWEDWGREDGMDVLAIGKKEFQTDPVRTYVTGHSMGGHGTWQFGAIYPHRFAAIGVSAGWCSFFTYVGSPRSEHPSPMQDIFQRANGTSDTVAMKNNFKSEGVYILHGDADDNVPVSEARSMRDLLSKFQHDLGYHEQKGAGHWWDGPAAPGADCLEWPDMMNFLRQHTLSAPKGIDFTTCDLRVNNEDSGVTILEQVHPLSPSRITINESAITVENVARFQLSPNWNQRGLTVNGAAVRTSRGGIYALANGEWRPSTKARVTQVGPFKEAFNNQVVLVYGTHGTSEQNRWALNKARYDSEAFWYRGNGKLDLISDDDYLKHKHPGNVVLYGNEDSNRAWERLLRAAPIKVRNHQIQVGLAQLQEDGAACLYCWHKPGEEFSIGVVSGTDLEGMRLTERLPYFTSGVGYPDWLIAGPACLRNGIEGVRAAGFFGSDGKVMSGDYVGRFSDAKP